MIAPVFPKEDSELKSYLLFHSQKMKRIFESGNHDCLYKMLINLVEVEILSWITCWEFGLWIKKCSCSSRFSAGGASDKTAVVAFCARRC